MASPIDELKDAFSGFTTLISEITLLVNEGPSSYPALYQTIKSIHQAILPIAYSLLTLYFLLDFLSKTMNFQFVRWETVVSCCVKLIFAKFVMEHVFDLLEVIFQISSYITTLVGATGSHASFFVDFTAVQADYDSKGWFDRKMYLFTLMPFIWILQGIKIVITLVVFGRLFQLLIYTAVSPIPIATFISDSLSGTGKRFLMDYAAVCLQGVIIIVGCVIYAAIMSSVTFGAFTGNGGNIAIWKGILSVLALLLVVVKSGAWAKKLTGA